MLGFDLADAGEERDVGEVLHAGVRTFARERVGVEFLRDVRLEWVEAQGRGLDAGESEHVARHGDVGLAEDGVRESDIEPKQLAVGLAGERTGDAVTLSFVDHPLVRDRGVLSIGRDAEHHEVAELELRRATKTFKQSGRWSDEPEVDVLRGAGAFDAKLDDETSLEDDAVAEL